MSGELSVNFICISSLHNNDMSVEATLRGRSIISMFDLSREDIEYLFRAVDQITKIPDEERAELLKGRCMLSMFFSPSTRTRLSFSIAMRRLGGFVVDFGGIQHSSMAKGETLEDTILTVKEYGVDIIVIRHPEAGIPRRISVLSDPIPVINAGDGSNEHPTQALLDLVTIRNECGGIDGLTYTIMGDLRHHRTAHSLAIALSKFDVEKIYLLSPSTLRLPRRFLDYINERVQVVEVLKTKQIDELLHQTDVLYITPFMPQLQDFYKFAQFLDDYAKTCSDYRLTPDRLRGLEDKLIILHPLPRHDLLSREIDRLRCAKYFAQVRYGLITRMAILCCLLGAI